ncbi:hypothetical protein Glove_174g50 [Diversispora epigaea]|uniref:Uncharacterized protein n=1 Tax=Diversispora epigaea TaxID=1348612 RepID=A0A397IS28_9GLOM|nr:hypothetical protein Glove_174g50 [Diversispora epigaea]
MPEVGSHAWACESWAWFTNSKACRPDLACQTAKILAQITSAYLQIFANDLQSSINLCKHFLPKNCLCTFWMKEVDVLVGGGSDKKLREETPK